MTNRFRSAGLIALGVVAGILVSLNFQAIADRNARLLMRQARAFRSRGDLELAYSAAIQARAFAREPAVRLDVDTMVASFSPPPTRVLKDRWSRPGWAPMVQILPLAVFGAMIAAAATFAASAGSMS